MRKKTTERISTLLTPDAKRKLREMAQDDKRRLSDMLRKLVLDAITVWEREKEENENAGH